MNQDDWNRFILVLIAVDAWMIWTLHDKIWQLIDLMSRILAILEPSTAA